MKVMKEPYKPEELEKLADENGYVEGNVIVPLSDIIDNDLEGFLDLLGEKLVANECLMDISYKAVGVTEEQNNDDRGIIIWVRGDASEVIRMNEEE